MAASQKGCELCGKAARMLCDSDQASLCWDCDEKVHAANFLEAKHSRTLLCHVCHSPTPWKADGPKLGPTISVCRACAASQDSSSRGWREEEEIDDDGCDSAESESDVGEYYSDNEEDDRDGDGEDGENQVVPWSESPASPSPSEENLSLSSSKRTRGDTPFESEDEDGCCSSHQNFEFKIGAHAQRLKTRRISNDEDGGLSPAEEEVAAEGGGSLGTVAAEGGGSLGTVAIVEKLRRFQQQGIVAGGEVRGTSAVVLDLFKLARC